MGIRTSIQIFLDSTRTDRKMMLMQWWEAFGFYTFTFASILDNRNDLTLDMTKMKAFHINQFFDIKQI